MFISSFMADFKSVIKEHNLPEKTDTITTIQINITKLCNQACHHCHVGASPIRTEMMDKKIMVRLLEIISENNDITTADITGGAPELHPEFQWFIEQLYELKKKIIVRHNLTVTIDGHPTTKENLSYLPEFFKKFNIELISSLPSFDLYLTNKQRGFGVFEKSIHSLKLLNAMGYGKQNTGLNLHLVYNPVGFFLPGNEQMIEKDFKVQLMKNFSIEFNNLFTITNMPINRFKESLQRKNQYEDYINKLKNAFNPATVHGLMCRSMINISYDGFIYDCDFNQMVDLPIKDKHAVQLTVFDSLVSLFQKRNIVFDQHCFGCTAGNGSSCGGSTI